MTRPAPRHCRACNAYGWHVHNCPGGDGMECGTTSPEVSGYGHAYCELRPGHDGPHREAEDGHVWEDES